MLGGTADAAPGIGSISCPRSEEPPPFSVRLPAGKVMVISVPALATGSLLAGAFTVTSYGNCIGKSTGICYQQAEGISAGHQCWSVG